MSTKAATRRNTFVGWLLIFLAVGVVVASVSANAMRNSVGEFADEAVGVDEVGVDEVGQAEIATGASQSQSSISKGFVPNGVAPGDSETGADTTVASASRASEAATDQTDPQRFRIISDGVLEDAATGIRREVTGVKVGQAAPSPEEIREFNSANNDLRSDLSNGFEPQPTRLVVDAIDLDAEVTPIGLDANRALAVPKRADITGWWSGGYAPGEAGPTVIVGHYDSKVAPGVFANLKDVTEGDRITVEQSDGSSYVYLVEFVERLHKTEFPTNLVYGPTDESTLRLVTCGGKFDRKTRHYVDNVIVYAGLVSSTGGADRAAGSHSSPYGPDSRLATNVPPSGFGGGAEGPAVPETASSLPPVGAAVPVPTTDSAVSTIGPPVLGSSAPTSVPTGPTSTTTGPESVATSTTASSTPPGAGSSTTTAVPTPSSAVPVDAANPLAVPAAA